MRCSSRLHLQFPIDFLATICAIVFGRQVELLYGSPSSSCDIHFTKCQVCVFYLLVLRTFQVQNRLFYYDSRCVEAASRLIIYLQEKVGAKKKLVLWA